MGKLDNRVNIRGHYTTLASLFGNLTSDFKFSKLQNCISINPYLVSAGGLLKYCIAILCRDCLTCQNDNKAVNNVENFKLFYYLPMKHMSSQICNWCHIEKFLVTLFSMSQKCGFNQNCRYLSKKLPLCFMRRQTHYFSMKNVITFD